MPQKPQHLVGAFALVGAVFILTGGFVSARMYYDVGGAPADVVALRYGVAAAVMLPIFIANLGQLSRDPGWARSAGLAVLGGAPFGICVLIGVAGAPVTHGAGIVPAVALLQGTFLSYWLLREPLPVMRLLGLVIALVGLAVLVLPELRSGAATWWGELSYIAAGVLWGSFTVALRAWRIKALQGAMLAAIFSSPYLVVYIAYLSPNILSVAPMQTIAHGVYQGIIFNVAAVMLYGWGIGRLGAVAAVATMPLMPVFGALMEWFILGRAPLASVWIAVAFIALGVTTTILADRGYPNDRAKKN